MVKPQGGTFRVLVGYDGSDDGVRALHYAAAQAVARQGSLSIIHAVDDTVLRSPWSVLIDKEDYKVAAVKLLAEAAVIARKRGLPDDRIDAEIVMGHPAIALVKLSAEVDLIVVGRRAIPGSERMFVGSTSMSVASTASCPVIMVSATSPEATNGISRIAVAVDAYEYGEGALRWAFGEARRAGIRLQVISVLKKPSSRLFGAVDLTDAQREAVLGETRRRLEALVSRVATGYPEVGVDYQVAYGDPAQVLVEATSSLDLMVLGVHASFPARGLGGTVKAVMAYSRCPVALVRA